MSQRIVQRQHRRGDEAVDELVVLGGEPRPPLAVRLRPDDASMLVLDPGGGGNGDAQVWTRPSTKSSYRIACGRYSWRKRTSLSYRLASLSDPRRPAREAIAS
jgi:hypothetical protein